MTTQEAQRIVNQVDKDARLEFDRFVSTANSAGTTTEKSAKSSITTVTAVIIGVCVFIGFLLLFGPWFLGIVIAGAGIFGGYKYNASGTQKLSNIKRARETLEANISNNRMY